MEPEEAEKTTMQVLSFLLGSTCLLFALFCWFMIRNWIGKIGMILVLVLVAWELFYFAATAKPFHYFRKK